jgi:Ni,Fe-hydrogenase I small subunit
MRKAPKKFGERTAHFNATQNEKRKYILAYEGQATEVQGKEYTVICNESNF